MLDHRFEMPVGLKYFYFPPQSFVALIRIP